VCLLEQALAVREAAAEPRHLTICVPLGATGAATVYLVRQEAPSSGLLRLKAFHRTAPSDYLDRFRELRQDLGALSEPAIVTPLAASVDACGRPSVLSQFLRGVPVVDAVRSGALAPRPAAVLVEAMADVMARAHGRGLAHGSLVSGNVLVGPDLASALLLDFGLSALLVPALPLAVMASRDQAELAVLLDAVRAL
jgi:serine/threonine protein kinase